MPGRTVPLVTKEIYHVFNKGMDSRWVFNGRRDFNRALQTFKFYLNEKPPLKLSAFLISPASEKDKLLSRIADCRKLVEVICFCFMPTHFHFLLRQLLDGGISKFIGNFQNSYTRYFNTKDERTGGLFYDQFKAVRIETDE